LKLTDKISLSFATYGLLYGAVLGITVAIAFFVVEDAILDHFLARAVEQVKLSAAEGVASNLPIGMTLHDENIAAELASLPEGRHEIAEYRHVAVFPHPFEERFLYLVLDETAAGLDIVLSRILFGTLLALIAAVVVGVMLARLVSRQLMRPMNKLVDRIDQLDIANPSLEPLPYDDEIGFLSERFSAALDLLKAHDRRERDFTRFASHELRSPITVLSGSTSILRSENSLTPRGRRALTRAESAVQRMTRLVEAFLFLGRAGDESVPSSTTSREIATEIDSLLSARESAGDHMQMSTEISDGKFVTNRFLLSIVLENLMINAVRHGTGELYVNIAPPSITLRNPIAHNNDAGHGFGLEIAERICERIGFELSIATDGNEFTAQLIEQRACNSQNQSDHVVDYRSA